MNSKYFRLASDYFLVDGKHEGVIYDVQGVQLFLLDKRAYQLLRFCEDNNRLDNSIGAPDSQFLETLRDLGIGSFHSTPVFVDKCRQSQPVEWKGMAQEPPQFFKVDIILTNDCDLSCDFCGRGDATISWQSCKSCLRRDKSLNRCWLPDCPENFIAEIERLGVQVLHVRGGNPLLNWEYLNCLIDALKDSPIQLVVTTPGTGRNAQQLINLCSNGQMLLNIVLFGGHDQSTYSTCGCHGVFEKQLKLLDGLMKAKAPFLVTGLLTGKCREKRNEIAELVRKKWDTECSFVETHFRTQMQKGKLLSHVDSKGKPLAPWQSAEGFFERTRTNSCMNGSLEIGIDGVLRTCVGSKKQHGNVAKNGLHSALGTGSLYESWELSKESIVPCKSCALRYACSDCHTFELEGEVSPVIKKAYCPHSPQLGEEKAFRKNWKPAGFAHPLRLDIKDTGKKTLENIGPHNS